MQHAFEILAVSFIIGTIGGIIEFYKSLRKAASDSDRGDGTK